MRYVCGVLALVVVCLTRPVRATSCAGDPARPLGGVLTPACTVIVRQYDPGVWLDHTGVYWVLRAGVPVSIGRDPRVLRIGVYDPGGPPNIP